MARKVEALKEDYVQQIQRSGLDPFTYLLKNHAITPIEETNLSDSEELNNRFTPYQDDPLGYMRDFFGIELWSAQVQIVEACLLAVRQQIERLEYQSETKTVSELKYWRPGQVIQNWISVDGGHIWGKTFLSAMMCNWFHDCFTPAITYGISPTKEHLRMVLFKEIKRFRQGRDDLRGKVYDKQLRIDYSVDHFMVGIALDDRGGKGGERVQGQHEMYQMFVIDEAEAAPDFLFKSLRTMTEGNVSLALFTRNPRTDTCMAHKIRKQRNCKAFSISCFDHPNVIQGKVVIPKAVTREYIENMCDSYTDIVNEHNHDKRTFELPWRPGIIYLPHGDFLYRVFGIVPSDLTMKTFCSAGRFEAACKRSVPTDIDKSFAYIGVDSARWGGDSGTIYVYYAYELMKYASISKQDSVPYVTKIIDTCKELRKKGVENIEIRVDGGGGYGSGIIDGLRYSLNLRELFEPLPQGKAFDGVQLTCLECGHNMWMVSGKHKATCQGCGTARTYSPSFKVIEVLNNTIAPSPKFYANTITELYANAGDMLSYIRLVTPPDDLKTDLCERQYDDIVRVVDGLKREVRVLESKKVFKKRNGGASPDNGDGAVLALAKPEFFRTIPRIAGIGGKAKDNRYNNRTQNRGIDRKSTLRRYGLR